MPDENPRTDLPNNQGRENLASPGTIQGQAEPLDAEQGQRRQTGSLRNNANAAQPAGHTVGDVRTGTGNAQITQAQTINNNNYIFGVGQAQEIRSGKRSRWVGIRGRGVVLTDSSDLMIRRVGHVMSASPPDPAFAGGEQEAASELSNTTLPDTVEAIRAWYRRFNELEQCFVRAIAVLSGAPENEVRRATSELYKPIIAEARRLAARRSQNEDILLDEPSIVLDEKFQAKTFTTIRKVDGARRVFWQDALANGFSAFAVRVLNVIELDAPINSHTGQGFLEQLEQLPRKFDGESAWRVPRALGALWLNSNESEFVQVANDWIDSETTDNWWEWRIANLLDGAYEVEYNVSGEKAAQLSKSVVLGLVDTWTTIAHSTSHEASRTRLGCAVAKTYGLIGQRYLKPALQGLDRLLKFPLGEEGETTLPLDVFLDAVWSYLELARFGAIRSVLAHLASNVEHLSRERRDRILRDRQEYINQRSVTLYAMFNTFTFLAVLSFREEQGITRGMYSRLDSLTPNPRVLDNEQDKDVLLAGILAAEETSWQNDILTLLCAMIVEENIDLAFYLMRTWADDVLRERGPESLALRSAYIKFMVDVIQKAEDWSNHLRRAGYRQRYTLKPCKNVLEEWRRESSQSPSPQPIGAFAKDVIRALDAYSDQ